MHGFFLGGGGEVWNDPKWNRIGSDIGEYTARVVKVSGETAFRRTSVIRVKRDYDELLCASRSHRRIQERTSINVGWFGAARSPATQWGASVSGSRKFMHVSGFWRNRPRPRSSWTMYVHKDHLSRFHRFSLPANILFFLLSHIFISLSFSLSLSLRASSLSPARLSFALCDPIFLLAPLSFSLPGLPRRHHPPHPRPVLPHPPASAVRDTSSRMSKGDEMRRLVGFHGDQPACTGISRLNRRRLSRHAALRCASRTDAGTTRR